MSTVKSLGATLEMSSSTALIEGSFETTVPASAVDARGSIAPYPEPRRWPHCRSTTAPPSLPERSTSSPSSVALIAESFSIIIIDDPLSDELRADHELRADRQSARRAG